MVKKYMNEKECSDYNVAKSKVFAYTKTKFICPRYCQNIKILFEYNYYYYVFYHLDDV